MISSKERVGVVMLGNEHVWLKVRWLIKEEELTSETKAKLNERVGSQGSWQME